jgi:serine/threonine-protein kinase RsbW
MAATTMKLVFGSDVRLVDVAHAASEKLAGVAGFDEDDALNVGIAVREAVINAIAHGNKMDPKRKVEVVLKAGPRALEARVRDQGAGFDPSATKDPTAAANVLNTSGRGLLLIRAFVDSVDFRFREGRGLEVVLVKKRTPRGTLKDVSSSARP